MIAAGTTGGWAARLRQGYGIARSLAIYRARPWRRRRALALYAQFVAKDALCFDLGAHLGDRTGYFRALGARVVAVEPQPELIAVLQRLYGRDPGVTLVEAAVGARPGTATLYRDPVNPTVATLSERFRRQVAASPAFAGVRWREARTVPVTTLAALIERFGLPDFTKIDVEGFEAEVLRGLNRPLPALSLEYVAASLEPALEALNQL